MQIISTIKQISKPLLFHSLFTIFILIFFLTGQTAYAKISNPSVVYLSEFGAYGDGIHDDTVAIQNALNSEYDTIIFDPGEYKITDYIMLTTNNKTIKGNRSIIFTDNDYRTRDNFYEWVINIRANNILIENLMIQARETILVGYKTQIGIQDATNVTLESCFLHIPASVYQNSQKRDLEYSNLDLYTNWHNVKISSCTIANYADTEHGVCVEFRDLQNKGCNDAYLTNSVCISNCHDEIIAAFSSSKDNAKKVSNINITNNYISALKTTYSSARNVGISLGYNPNGISNLTFENNQVKISSDFTLFTIGNNYDCHINNNSVKFYIIEDSSAYLARSYAKPNEVLFEDNEIEFIHGKNSKIISKYYGNIKTTNNLFSYI